MTDEKNIFLESVLKAVPIKCLCIGDTIEGTIRQEYINGYDIPLEVVYTFPAPDKAAITGMTIMVGERRIETAVVEKEQADKQYAKAIVDGNSAFLLESERPNINRLTLGRVEPGEHVVAEMRFSMLRDLTDGHVRISIPTVIAPRYIPCRLVGGSHGEFNVDEDRINPPFGETGYMAELEMEIEPMGEIAMDHSPSHRLVYDMDANGRWHVGLEDGCCEANCDIVVLYHYVNNGASCVGVIGESEQGRLLMAQFIPSVEKSDMSPRAYSILLDCSGSMDDKMDEAKKAVQDMLSFLKPGDSFQILCFNHEVRDITKQYMREYDCIEGEAAICAVSRVTAGGGTEILPPLRIALECSGKQRNHCVILITDGQVGNEREILAYVRLHKSNNTRIFTVGIGSAANSYLINELAELGRGAAEHVCLGETMRDKVERQMIRCANPRSHDVQLRWSDGKACREMEPPVLPELFDGDIVSAVLRINGDEQWPLVLSGTADNSRWECRLSQENIGSGDGAFIQKMMARRKIRRFEREYDVAENEYVKDELKQRAIDESAENGVLSRWTTYYSEMLRQSGDTGLPYRHHVRAASRASRASMTAQPDDALLSSLFGGRGFGYARNILEDHEPDKYMNRRESNMEWRRILNERRCKTDRDADRVVEKLQVLWERGLTEEPVECRDICDVLRGLIGNKKAAGACNINIYNMIVLAADAVLCTNAIQSAESYILDALITISEDKDEQLHQPVVELMLDVITALASGCEKEILIRNWAQSIARNIQYAIKTPGTKRLCYAAECLQIQCLCYNRNMQRRRQ